MGEGVEGWEHFSAEDRELGSATGPQGSDLERAGVGYGKVKLEDGVNRVKG